MLTSHFCTKVAQGETWVKWKWWKLYFPGPLLDISINGCNSLFLAQCFSRIMSFESISFYIIWEKRISICFILDWRNKFTSNFKNKPVKQFEFISFYISSKLKSAIEPHIPTLTTALLSLMTPEMQCVFVSVL